MQHSHLEVTDLVGCRVRPATIVVQLSPHPGETKLPLNIYTVI